MIRDTAIQRWWKLSSTTERTELRREAGRYDVLRLWVEARLAPQIPRILVLRPGSASAVVGEVGPACDCCGDGLHSSQWLAACTVCLRVFHRDCLDRPDRCALVACQEEWSPP